MLINGLSHNKSSVQTAMRAIELILLSAGFISTILMFKGAVESSCLYDMVLSTLRKPWFYFRSLLSSPFYICIIMNLIVILIAASSLFHHHKMENTSDAAVSVGGTEDDDFGSSLPPPLSPPPSAPPPVHNSHQNHLEEAKKASAQPPSAAAATVSFENHHYHDRWQDDEVQYYTFKIESVTEAKEIKKEKPLDSSAKVKTTHQTTTKKGQAKANEKQRQQEPSKEQQQTENDEEEDTMEATWRAITGEGSNPQNKQLKKSETWPQPPIVFPSQENTELEEELEPSAAAGMELKKSMTFNDTISIRCRGGLRRDPSMSLEEFNGRVEAFIKKFNNDMQLQRQESEQRYLEMINRSL